MTLPKLSVARWAVFGGLAGCLYALLTGEWFLGPALGLTGGTGTAMAIKGFTGEVGDGGGEIDCGGDGGD